MTLREDLESILSADFALRGDDYRAFLSDHGQALVEAVRDAERYRWLRDAKTSSALSGSIIELWLFSRPSGTTSGSIDAAIDAAMKGVASGGS